MSTSRILDKIQKCLALSESSNEHEAASALRHAQKMMAEHNLTASDLELHTVGEAEARCATKSKSLPVWVAFLRSTIGEAFGVQYMNRWQKIRGTHYNWAVFVGVGEKPAAAQYTYEVLFRQITADREAFKKTLNPRLPTVTKTRRCNLFCESWVVAVNKKVEEIALDDKEKDLIKRYKQKSYGELKEGKVRETPPPTSRQDNEALWAGSEQGRNAQLFRGVNAREADKQLG